jgi:hypothetical protein
MDINNNILLDDETVNNYNLEFFKLLIINQIYIYNKNIQNQIHQNQIHQNQIDQNQIDQNTDSNNLKINLIKENILLNKIVDTKKKYKYFKYKIHNNDKNIYKIFITAQKIYFFYLKFITKKTKINSTIHNSEDLIGNIFEKDDKIFRVYINRFIYNFTYYDFVKLVNNSLLNYEEPINMSLDDVDNILFKPTTLKNPYTNLYFKKNVLYNFYLYCFANKFKIPTLYILYYESNFHIKKLIENNETYIVKKAFFGFIKNLSPSKKHILLIQTINMFTNFIIKHIQHFAIKYLAHNYKLKFYNIDASEIEYYNSFLHTYLIIIFYYNNKIYKNYVNNKLKLVMDLLYDTNIKFIDPSIQTFLNSEYSSEKIAHILIKNINNIINKELDSINLNNTLTNINNLLNVNNNNSQESDHESGETNNGENTGETTDNGETFAENSETQVYTNNINLFRRIFYIENTGDTTSNNQTNNNNNNNDISLINITNDFLNNNISNRETIVILENKQKNIKNYKNKFYILREAIKTNFYPFLNNINKTLFIFTKANIYILTNIYVSQYIYKNFKN